MALQVLLDTDDTCVDREPFSTRFYPGDDMRWRFDALYSGVAVEPHSGVLMLAGRADPTVSSLASGWTLGGTGAAWDTDAAQPCGLWDAAHDTKFLHQTKGTATNLTATFGTVWGGNVPLVFDCYFYGSQPTGEGGAPWQAKLWFGGRYCIVLEPKKPAQLWRSDPEMGGQYLQVAQGDLAPEDLFGEHFQVRVQTCGVDQLVITSGSHPKGICYIEAQTEMPAADGRVYRDIMMAAAPVVEWSAGEAVIGLRPYLFNATGYMLGPVGRLPWQTYTGALAVSQNGVLFNGAGQSAVVTLVQPNGTAAPEGFDFGRSGYRPKITLTTTDRKQTPQLHWASIDVPGTSLFVPGTNEDFAGEICELETSLSLDGEMECTLKMRANSGNEHVAQQSWLTRRGRVIIDGVPVFDGYFEHPKVSWGTGGEIWLTFAGKSRLKRLDWTYFYSSKAYDGWVHTAVVADVLQNAGLAASEYHIAVDTDRDVPVMPVAKGMEKPVAQPADGVTAKDFIKHIRETVSGWMFYAGTDGVFYYVPRDLSFAPVCTLYDNTAAAKADPASPYTVSKADQERDEETYHNEIIVWGRDRWGRTLSAFWANVRSWTQRSAPDYLGILRRLVYGDPALNTLAKVQQALAILILDHGFPFKWRTLKCPGVIPAGISQCVAYSEAGVCTSWTVWKKKETRSPGGEVWTELYVRSVPA